MTIKMAKAAEGSVDNVRVIEIAFFLFIIPMLFAAKTSFELIYQLMI